MIHLFTYVEPMINARQRSTPGPPLLQQEVEIPQLRGTDRLHALIEHIVVDILDTEPGLRHPGQEPMLIQGSMPGDDIKGRGHPKR